jgi:hypothetical protein
MSCVLPRPPSATARTPTGASWPPKEISMPDGTSNRGAQDRARINVNEDHEVRYWTSSC